MTQDRIEDFAPADDLTLADFCAIPLADSRIATRLLYFARSDSAFELLKAWTNLCGEFNALCSSYLLDAAWAAVVAQRTMTTVWFSSDPAYSSLASSSLSNPAQRTGRRAHRTAAPEPQFLSKSEYSHGEAITLIVIAGTASAHDCAATMTSAINAFEGRGGSFGTLAILIATDRQHAARLSMQITFGWLLFVPAGTTLAETTIAELSDRKSSDQPTFIMPRDQHRVVGPDLIFNLIHSQAVFCKADTFYSKLRLNRSRPSLKLVQTG